MQPNINNYKEKYLSVLKRDPNNDELQLLSFLNKLFADNQLVLFSYNDEIVPVLSCQHTIKFHAGNNQTGYFGVGYAQIPAEINYSTVRKFFSRLYMKLAASGAEPVLQSASLLMNPANGHNKPEIINNLGQCFSSSTIPLIEAHIAHDKNLRGQAILSSLVAALRPFPINAPDRKKTYKIYLAGPFQNNNTINHFKNVSTGLDEALNSICTLNILCETLKELITLNIAAGIDILDAQGLFGFLIRMAIEKIGCSIELSELMNKTKEKDMVTLLSIPLPYTVAILTESGKEEELLAILSQRNISYIFAGVTTAIELTSLLINAEKKAELPLGSLLSMHVNQNKTDTPRKESNSGVKIEEIPDPENIKDVIQQLVGHSDLMINNCIHRKLDAAEGSINMNFTFPSTAGVVKLNRDNNFMLTSLVANQRYSEIDFCGGAVMLIAEAARNILCTGGIPQSAIVAVFSAEKDMPSLIEQVNAIKSAGEKLNIETNVCFQISENDTGSPIVHAGIAGIMKNRKEYTTIDFKDKGHMIYLIGESRNDLNGSVYIDIIHKKHIAALPAFDLKSEVKLHKTIRGLTDKKLIMSANNIGKGGLFFSLLQSALVQNFGFDITSPAEMRLDTFLFSESGSRVVVTVAIERETEFIDFMMQQGFPFSALGHVTKEELRIDDISYGYIGDYYENCLSAINNFFSDNQKANTN